MPFINWHWTWGWGEKGFKGGGYISRIHLQGYNGRYFNDDPKTSTLWRDKGLM